MKHAQYVHCIRLLNDDTLKNIRQLISTASYIDGKTTATDSAKAVKNNLQISLDDRTVLPQLQQLVGMAIMAEPRFIYTFYAAKAYHFLFSRCEKGMGYGRHVDSPMMGNPPMRTDLAMTIFLDDPETYEGGELVICSGDSEFMYKPKAGEAVIYPCQYVHYVNEVRSGVRNVAVTWFQSSVRSAEHRQTLSDIKSVHEKLAATDPQGEHTQLLLQTWSNLLRLWGEA